MAVESAMEGWPDFRACTHNHHSWSHAKIQCNSSPTTVIHWNELQIKLDTWSLGLHTTVHSWHLFLHPSLYPSICSNTCLLTIHKENNASHEKAELGFKMVVMLDLDISLLLSCLICKIGIITVIKKTHTFHHYKD
jgi:hypothetical protein